jgi:hypothetical protein
MTYMESRRLDHLTLFPEVPLRSAFLQMSMAGALVGLLSLYQPWRAERTGRHGLGVGAFNLVRACAYRALGGHRVIPMDVLDDVELGRLMSETGRQELLLAKGMVSVEIYSSAGELLRGMQKNLFTFLRYSFWMLLAATLGIFAVVVWPWIGLFAPDPVARAVNATTVAILFAFYAKILWQGGYGLRGLAWLPLNGLISIVMFWQVAIRTWIQGGVVWRGTLYPLAELKRRKRG